MPQGLPSVDAARILLTIGMVGGIAGGMVFGMLMAMQDMLPMVAALVGYDSAAVRFGVHLDISASAEPAFGAAVAAVPALVATPVVAVAAGALYGVAWWIAGALVAMPLILGMSQMVFVIEQTQLMSLMGHVVFRVVTSLVWFAAAATDRRPHPHNPRRLPDRGSWHVRGPGRPSGVACRP